MFSLLHLFSTQSVPSLQKTISLKNFPHGFFIRWNNFSSFSTGLKNWSFNYACKRNNIDFKICEYDYTLFIIINDIQYFYINFYITVHEKFEKNIFFSPANDDDWREYVWNIFNYLKISNIYICIFRCLLNYCIIIPGWISQYRKYVFDVSNWV